MQHANGFESSIKKVSVNFCPKLGQRVIEEKAY